MDESTVKVCRRCLAEKGLDEFSPRTSSYQSHQAWCKACRNEVYGGGRRVRTAAVAPGIKARAAALEQLAAEHPERFRELYALHFSRQRPTSRRAATAAAKAR